MRKRIAKTALVVLSIFIGAHVCAEKNFNDMFNEFLKEAPSLNDSSLKKASEHKIEDKIDGYTSNPEQTNHYREDQEGESDVIEMKQKAEKEAAPDLEEAPSESAGKKVTRSFKERIIYKIDKNDPDVAAAKEVEANPEKHTKTTKHSEVTLEKRTSCEKKKTMQCEQTFNEEKCNEQVRALVKICDVVPKITTSIREVVYPKCQNLIHVNGVERVGCPAGYTSLDYMYMIRFTVDPNVRFCVKDITVAEGAECFGGFFGAGIMHANYKESGSGRAIVPKKRQARIKISHAYNGSIVGTIINETTGTTLHDKATFNNGQIIPLPFSETQDQAFRFYAVNKRRRPLGIMTLYIDHVYQEKVAKLESWLEVNCSET